MGTRAVTTLEDVMTHNLHLELAKSEMARRLSEAAQRRRHHEPIRRSRRLRRHRPVIDA
jgi:hypothetical protein